MLCHNDYIYIDSSHCGFSYDVEDYCLLIHLCHISYTDMVNPQYGFSYRILVEYSLRKLYHIGHIDVYFSHCVLKRHSSVLLIEKALSHWLHCYGLSQVCVLNCRKILLSITKNSYRNDCIGMV